MLVGALVLAKYDRVFTSTDDATEAQHQNFLIGSLLCLAGSWLVSCGTLPSLHTNWQASLTHQNTYQLIIHTLTQLELWRFISSYSRCIGLPNMLLPVTNRLFPLAQDVVA